MSIAVLYWLGAVSLVEAAVAMRMYRLMGRFRERPYLTSPQILTDMPSVSVCIAARNERHAMTRCIESVLASTYPKMEVLVLDDDSVDNTSSLIKAFAHEGVRFIQGGELPDGWLGRNHALQRLLNEASGTYVLFIGVDTILSPQSIAQLVAYAEARDARMISVLPQRRSALTLNVLFSPFRYFWQIVGHRTSHPVFASSVWMAKRKNLQTDFNDMVSLKNSIEPELDIARYYFAHRTYKFLVSRSLLGISYDKKMTSQVETIVRIRYPQLGYSSFMTLTTSFIKIAVALTPLLAVTGSYAAWLAALVYLIGVVLYRIYLKFAWSYGANIGMWLWPAILCLDAYLSLLSMYRHLTHTVTWKGRRINTTRQSS